VSFEDAFVPPGIPRRGNAFWRWVGRTALKLTNWRLEGAFPDVAKCVVAVAPHTSNWDFPVGASAMFALDLKCKFIGKHTLFVGPLGRFLRWMGGIPVDRSAAHGVVGEAVDAFRASPQFMLVIAPEGTRSRVHQFKTGFLHIARGAGVPVVPVALDWGTRTIRIGLPIDVAGDIAAERVRVEAHFAQYRGRNR
jgi:1-acyl-sn-glycerol-3-phosphate acyltransferase